MSVLLAEVVVSFLSTQLMEKQTNGVQDVAAVESTETCLPSAGAATERLG